MTPTTNRKFKGFIATLIALMLNGVLNHWGIGTDPNYIILAFGAYSGANVASKVANTLNNNKKGGDK